MQERAERAVRGTSLGVASVILAAAGHAVAGGGVPGWLGLLAGVVAASVVGALVVGRRPSLPRTAVTVLAGQAGFHWLFAGLGGPGVDLAAPHIHAAGSVVVHGGHVAHLADSGMAVAHLVAAAITLVLLRHAESAVWGMLRRALARLLGPLLLPGVAAPRRTAPRSRPRTPPRRTATPPPPLRGPPALLST